MKREEHKDTRLLVLLGAMAVGVFVLDFFLPRSLAVMMGYATVVWAGIFCVQRRNVWLVAVVCSILCVGSFLLRGKQESGTEATNRLLAVGLIWASTVAAWWHLRAGDQRGWLEGSAWEAAMDTQGVGLVVLDTEGHVKRWSAGARGIYGFDEEDVLGKNFGRVYPVEEVERRKLEQDLRIAAREGRMEEEGWRVKKGGALFWAQVSLSALRNENGTVLGFLEMTRDTSQQKELEEEVNTLRTQVTRRMEQRDAALARANDALQAEIRERQRVEEDKLQSERLAVAGGMAAKFAHEIRNPLSSIILNVGLVGRTVVRLGAGRERETGEVRELLQAIEGELRRINRITENYMRFSRPPKMQRVLVSLNALLERELVLLHAQFEKNEVQATTEFDSELPLILGDEDQIWQAILNLVRNALGAMRHGGHLKFRTTHNGDDVMLIIADTGKGMPTEVIEQIFKPFFSARDTGIGLGLPITLQIVNEHGGRIECQSAVGKGTTFIIHLPAAKEI